MIYNCLENQDGDPEFEVTAEMLVHGEDNEGTLEEEESFNDIDHESEIGRVTKGLSYFLIYFFH